MLYRYVLYRYVKYVYSLCFLLGTSGLAFSQEVNRYMVFFTDKAGTPHTISDPSAYLSPRSLMRREKNNVRISMQDLPVSPDYVARIQALGVETYYTTRWMNGLLVQCSEEKSREIAGEAYVNEVEYVALGRKLGPFVPYTIPPQRDIEDPVYFSTDPENKTQLSMLGVLDMHRQGYRGEGVLIAVFDDGFGGVSNIDAFDHIFAQGRLVSTYNYVKNDERVFRNYNPTHGTSTLSCIAAYIKDVYVGTAYKASYALFQTEDVSTEYRIEEYNWLFAAEKADSLGVDVISSSLGYTIGFTDPTMDYTYEELNGMTTVTSRAARGAQRRGIMVVNSAGNAGTSTVSRWITSPCDADSILCVGGVDKDEERAPFSSIGPASDDRIKPDIAAMGAQTIVIGTNSMRGTRNGTSFSVPLISGFVACFMERYPDKTVKEVRDNILASGHQVDMPDNLLGSGIPHFSRHVEEPGESISHAVSDAAASSYRLSVYPNPLEPGDTYLNISCTSLREYTQVDFLFYLFDGILQKYIRQPLPFSDKKSVFNLSLGDIPPGIYVLKVRLLGVRSFSRPGASVAVDTPSMDVVHEYESVRIVVQ